MLARIILGAVGGYGLFLIATALSVSGGDKASDSLRRLKAATMYFKECGNFEALLVIPTLVGAVAGYCWHILASKRNG